MFKVIVDFGHEGFKIEAVIESREDNWVCIARTSGASHIEGIGTTVTQAIGNFKNNIRNKKIR